MIRKSNRKNRPLIFVEGNLDHKVICRLCNTKKIDVEKISSTSSNNKLSLIQLISDSKSNDLAIGIVDADYDWICQRLYGEENLPYHQKIIDTSPYTDMNLILIDAKGIEEYLRNEGLTDSQIEIVNDVSKWMGIIRTLKRRYEVRNNCIAHIKLKNMRNNISEGFIPTSIQELIGKIRIISPQSAKRFFDDIERYNRLTKMLNRYEKEDFEFYEIVNGHDVTAVMKGLGHRGVHSKIEKRLMNNLDHNVLIKNNLFLRLKEWGDKIAIIFI